MINLYLPHLYLITCRSPVSHLRGGRHILAGKPPGDVGRWVAAVHHAVHGDCVALPCGESRPHRQLRPPVHQDWPLGGN